MVSTLLILALQVKLHNNQQLLNVAEYDMKNYADQVECYPSRLKAENSIILHIIRKSNTIIVHFYSFKNISEFLIKKRTSCRLSSKLTSGYKQTFSFFAFFFLQIFQKKQITSVEQYIFLILAFLPFSLSQEVTLFCLGIAVNAMFFSFTVAQEDSFLACVASVSHRVIARKQQPIMVGGPCGESNRRPQS